MLVDKLTRMLQKMDKIEGVLCTTWRNCDVAERRVGGSLAAQRIRKANNEASMEHTINRFKSSVHSSVDRSGVWYQAVGVEEGQESISAQQ